MYDILPSKIQIDLQPFLKFFDCCLPGLIEEEFAATKREQ
jgi:hypothetical protein